MRNLYTMKVALFLCLFVFLHLSNTHAQVSSYSFNTVSDVYSPITGGLLLGTETTDDQRFVDPLVPAGGTLTTGVGLPIAFDFTFNGQVYDRLAINANGWISLGSSLLTPAVNNASTSAYTPLSSTAVTTPAHLRNRISAVGRDLQAQVGATLRLETIGTAPNRVCIVQWSNYKKFGTAGTGDNYNFQIRLYETTNIVEVVFGTFVNNATNLTAQVGLGGSVATDFNNRTTTTNWATTTAGAANTATCTATATIAPASGTTYRWVSPPPTPPNPFQIAATTSCLLGTQLDVVGTPPADVEWYWQTSGSGTSMVDLYTGPYTVLSNGTYFLRAFNSSTSTWSTNSSSITVSDFPTATSPPAPIAAQNPACAPGTTLTMNTPPSGFEYYWQGTVVNGSSTLQPATNPFSVNATGTYYVSAFESASGCWSNTVGLLVTVDSQIPSNPIVTENTVNICSGSTSGLISATATTNIAASIATTQAGGNGCTNGNMLNIATNADPIVLTSITVTPNTTGAQNVQVYYRNGTYVGNETNIAAWTLLGSYPITGTIGVPINVDIADLPIPASTIYGIYLNYNAQYSNLATTYTNADLTITTGAGFCTAFSGPIAGRTFNGTFFYEKPVPTNIAWYDNATGGSQIGTGSPFETVGSMVMPSANIGVYSFYAASQAGGCFGTERALVTVNVVNVNAVLTPINASCNGNNNGSFTLATVECGTEPFLYSVDGGAFGAIPTDLTAGTYSVVIEDAGGLFSAPITVVVGQPAPPANLTLVDANYFSADISWTTTGDETSWTVEYGLAGFTPGTGTEVVVFTNSATLTELTENTAYQFYVTPNCGAGAETAGPANFNTNAGFFTYDNQCGPGFVDISATGTPLNLADDATTIVTAGFPLSYQGITSDQVTISNNGWLQIGGFAGVQMNVWNNDWDDESGNVYHQTLNDGTDNWFIVQWDDRPRFPGVIGQSVTFQVLVNQTTSEVFYVYDDVVVGGTQATNDFGGQGTIGFQGPQGNIIVSQNNTTYLTNNSCVRWYFALCPDPILVSNQIFQEEVILDWNAGLYGETEWTLIYGPAGFDPATEGTTITVTSSDANIFGLTQVTDYDVYIYSECSADDLTSGGLLVSFQTLPWCNNVTGLTAATAVDSLFASWNWTPVAGATNGGITGFNIQYGQTGFDLYSEGTVVTADGINFADTVANPAFLAGGVYQVYVQSVCGVDTSNYAGPVTFIMPLTNDAVCSPETLQADGTVYTFNNTGATVQAGEGTIAPPATGANTETGWINNFINNSTWFTFVAPASGNVRINNTAINYNGQAAVYMATDCADWTTFELMAANDNSMLSSSLAPNFSVCGLTPGATYYLLHDGFNATTGNYSISITPIVLNAGALVDVMDVCTGGSVDLFDGITGYDNGGVWSAELPSAGTQLVGSDWNSAGFAYQIFNFEYRMTDGCAFDTTFAKVRVWAPSNAGTDGSVTVCRNEPFDLLSGLNGTVDLGGNWLNPSLQPIASSAITSSNIPGQFNYYYIASNGICPNDTALVLVNVSSTCNYLDVEEMFFGTMTIMPNPSNGVFNISNIGSTEVFNYEVTDLDGRVIFTKDAAINGTETTVVDLTNKVTGMYMIRVYNDNAEKIFRVIKQ
jgi:hypothetical protein